MSIDEKRAALSAGLQTALELELATIPAYLVALLSIKLPQNRDAAERIRSVAIEEMLHLALVANVINAVGGTVRIDRNANPVYPLVLKFNGKAFADRRFPVPLAAFSPNTIKTFMEIEKPASMIAAVALGGKIDVPAPTIGQFYDDLIKLLEEIEAEAPGSLFVGDPARQLDSDYYWAGGGQVTPVTDLASAKAALTQAITQGEGSWPATPAGFAEDVVRPFGIGHYYRFAEIHFGKHFTPADDPAGKPTGPAIEIDYAKVYPILENAKAADYTVGSRAAELNHLFNIRYTTMLRQLEDAMTGSPKVLFTAIMHGMHGLTSVARKLMATPVDGDEQGRTGCPTFEWTQ
ncbi:ferritin-like protein [Novosphingobium sp. G106]|uniref:ferritin-like domain-containing protein n=1 Tax=Novosphingobium sp. G106 TaxID=2849500 RepID=UPI001C2CFBB6|nr:ferritin-like protein [Novosphingobium sp. G106]MBV1686349.1 ferritin-like protein [Novosphingobium sp. G106]